MAILNFCSRLYISTVGRLHLYKQENHETTNVHLFFVKHSPGIKFNTNETKISQ